MKIHDQTLYHIGLRADQGAAFAIITGDPGRVEGVARRLEQPEFVAQEREFTTWAGRLAGERVLVTSHGIGGPSTAICVEELSRCGVRTLIRMGTCGGMQREVCGGDLVVATAAIRQEGTSREYLPLEFPAVADWRVTGALMAEAAERGWTVHAGVVHCKDSFYGQHSPEDSPVAPWLTAQWQAWLRGGCLASEMESAALYTVAAAKGLRAGCVLAVIWNQERDAAGLPNPHCTDPSRAIDTALGGMKRLIQENRQKETV